MSSNRVEPVFDNQRSGSSTLVKTMSMCSTNTTTEHHWDKQPLFSVATSELTDGCV